MAIEWTEFENGQCEHVKLQPNGSEIRMSYGPSSESYWWEAYVVLTEPFTRTVRLAVDGFAKTAAEARAKCEAAHPILQAMAAANADAMQQLYAIAGGTDAD